MTEGCTGQFNPDTTAIVNMRGRPKSTSFGTGSNNFTNPENPQATNFPHAAHNFSEAELSLVRFH